MKERRNFFVYSVFAIIILSIIFVFTCMIIGEKGYESKIKHLTFVGEYSIDGMQFHKINEGYTLSQFKTERLIIRGNIIDFGGDKKSVYTLVPAEELTVKKNSEMIYSNRDRIRKGRLPFAEMWIELDDLELGSADTIKAEFVGEGAGSSAEKFIGSLCTGDSIEILQYNLRMHLYQIIVGVLMFCIGLALSITVIILNFLHKDMSGNFIYCGGLLVVGGLCTLIDYSYITLLFKNIWLINAIDCISMGIMCVFIVLYMGSFIINRTQRAAAVLLAGIISAMILLYFVFDFLNIITMQQYVSVQVILTLFSIVAVLILLVMNIVREAKNKTRERKQIFLALSGCFLALFIGEEMVHYFLAGSFRIPVFQLGLLIFSLMQFTLLVKEANDSLSTAQEAERLKTELAEHKIKIMLSQIQPHFLYNTLTAIGVLCDKDPAKAKKATIDFSRYLRGNLNSLGYNEPVAFETELKHISIYIDLEKMRFEDELNMIYDIETEDFMVPALTIQPLVENAVKYGVGRKENGGTVVLSTKEYDNYYEIVVSDDGVGFDPYQKQYDGRTHIGIDNVKARLLAMCRATLEIKSEKGKGTTATIKIPKGENK